nr:dihydrofolate reductase family protein [Serratia marcescens]
MKCSVYIATSVDGFIAGPDGDIDWLLRPEYAVSLLNGLSFEAFVADIDALVMGRHTYDKVRAFPEWPYGALPVVVLSTQPPAPHATGHVRWMNGEPAAIVAQLAEQGCRHLYIDGGQTVQRFLQAGLIDELTITRVPLAYPCSVSMPLSSACVCSPSPSRTTVSCKNAMRFSARRNAASGGGRQRR